MNFAMWMSKTNIHVGCRLFRIDVTQKCILKNRKEKPIETVSKSTIRL